ncbi:MAG: AAA family ATPase [Beijerinckiaceae bacterium]|nr:AAA family ATPase [Beijerinckiaceae bacterium]MCI0734697.1 AAA family ATPase [Beijerinckiaceae bacterium]
MSTRSRGQSSILCFDFSTLDKRRLACERELAVNRVYTPDLYLGVVPISRDGSHLRFGIGNIVEWAVHLRRFDETSTLDRLAARGELGFDIIAKLASAAGLSHRQAPITAAASAYRTLQGQSEETLASLEGAPEIFAPKAAEDLRKATQHAFAQCQALLIERELQGQVRRCHGDLHLRNIALIDGEPVLFDAIEFDESIATCDVLYDFSFLLMDLWTRGLRRHANLLFNHYLWACGDMELQLKGLSLLPLFLSMRAAIRAKVIILQPGKGTEHVTEARRHFEAARAYLAPARLDLIAIGGLSGSGKSSLAAALAGYLGRAPGAVHLRSDIERKRHYGVQESDRLPQDAYRPEDTALIYDRLRKLASIALGAGQSAIIDAVHLKEEERRAVERVADSCNARFTGLWLEAPIATLMERVSKRGMDASDATAEVVQAQSRQHAGPMEWLRLDTSGEAKNCAADALAALAV